MPDLYKKGFANITGKALSSASLEEYSGKVRTGSATEGLDDDALNDAVNKEFKYFVANAIAQAVLDGRVFFTQDGKAAYEELVAMLQDEEVKEEAVRIMEKEFSSYKGLDEFTDSTEAIDKTKTAIRCGQLSRRSQAAEQMCKVIKKAEEDARAAALSKYPDLFGNEEEEVDEGELAKRTARHEERMKRWGGRA
ncbi:MAG: hypothetical protein NC218_01730 [Acetobacter sp.]|nr:hypothetical protein [Acetobacter sp.]